MESIGWGQLRAGNRLLLTLVDGLVVFGVLDSQDNLLGILEDVPEVGRGKFDEGSFISRVEEGSGLSIMELDAKLGHYQLLPPNLSMR